jgi:hypothetical protein
MHRTPFFLPFLHPEPNVPATLLIPLCAVAVSAAIQAAGLLIWGASLTQRVRQLEADVEPLKLLPERFARIEVRLDGMYEQLKDLNSSIRWMREPVDGARG